LPRCVVCRKGYDEDRVADPVDGDNPSRWTSVECPRYASGVPRSLPAKSAPSDLPTTVYRQDIRRRVAQGRIYVWPPTPDGIEYPSVTSILQALPKDALMYWAAKSVAQAAVESYDLLGKLIEKDSGEAVKWLKGTPWGQRDRAGLDGTTIHDLCEAWITGDTVTSDHILRKMNNPQVKAKAEQLEHCLDTLPVRWIQTEAVVLNREVGYAGTVDLVGIIDDVALCQRFGTVPPFSVTFDIKTGKGVYPETALQLTAYRYAPERVDHIDGTLVPNVLTDGAAVIHITDESWALIPVVSSPTTYAMFKEVVEVAKHLPLPDTMVGLPVVRGSR